MYRDIEAIRSNLSPSFAAHPHARVMGEDPYHSSREEGDHWTDYWGLICGLILMVFVVSVLVWAYIEDQKELARMAIENITGYSESEL